MTIKPSMGSVLLNEALKDPAQKQALQGVAHRTQLWTYRTGKAKPTVDRAAKIAEACPAVPADSWAQPPPKKQRKPKAEAPATEACEPKEGAA